MIVDQRWQTSISDYGDTLTTLPSRTPPIPILGQHCKYASSAASSRHEQRNRRKPKHLKFTFYKAERNNTFLLRRSFSKGSSTTNDEVQRLDYTSSTDSTEIATIQRTYWSHVFSSQRDGLVQLPDPTDRLPLLKSIGDFLLEEELSATEAHLSLAGIAQTMQNMSRHKLVGLDGLQSEMF